MKVIPFITLISIFCFVNFSLSCKVESSTHSAVADGTITIRDKEEQKQNVENLRRETKDTLNKLDKIFDRDKIEEKQELAGLFSELVFNAIHNLSQKKVIDENGKEKIVSTWNEGQKVMAHALVGYVSGELAGSKSSFSNALAAGVNKFVTEEILKDEKTRLHYAKHPEELQWISAALGAAIGQMAGGDATSGASIAASGTKNNKLDVPIKKVTVIETYDGIPHREAEVETIDGEKIIVEHGGYGSKFPFVYSYSGGAILEVRGDYPNVIDGLVENGNAKVLFIIDDPKKAEEFRQKHNNYVDNSREFIAPNDDGSIIRQKVYEERGNDIIAYRYNSEINGGYQTYNIIFSDKNCVGYINDLTGNNDYGKLDLAKNYISNKIYNMRKTVNEFGNTASNFIKNMLIELINLKK